MQHAGLCSSIDAPNATQTAGTDITYTIAANHLSTAVSELPESIAKKARNVSLVQTGGGGGSTNMHNKDESSITGHIPNWKSLSFQERKVVIDERKRLDIKHRYKGGAGAGRRGENPSSDNRIKQLKEQNSKYKRAIKALKIGNMTYGNDDIADENPDAGDQFGDKASKKKTKTKYDSV